MRKKYPAACVSPHYKYARRALEEDPENELVELFEAAAQAFAELGQTAAEELEDISPTP